MQEHYFETIIIPSDCEEVFADFLLETTQNAIEERNIDLDISKIINNPLYLNAGGTFSSAKAFVVYSSNDTQDTLIPFLKDFCTELSDRLEQTISVAYQIKCYKNQDWIQNYKDSVTPVKCGKFYIRPSWYESVEGSIDILINPALAFGSGHHASTAMCLQMLSDMSLEGKDVLDVGCGSGILSIAAKKSGGNVHLCDTDPLAVNESRKNFALNALKVDKIWEGSIDKAPQKYDVIIANILAEVIKMLYQDFIKALKPHSVLILSGILEDYYQSVLETFKGFQILEILHKDEWVGIKLTQKEYN